MQLHGHLRGVDNPCPSMQSANTKILGHHRQGAQGNTWSLWRECKKETLVPLPNNKRRLHNKCGLLKKLLFVTHLSYLLPSLYWQRQQDPHFSTLNIYLEQINAPAPATICAWQKFLHRNQYTFVSIIGPYLSLETPRIHNFGPAHSAGVPSSALVSRLITKEKKRNVGG